MLFRQYCLSPEYVHLLVSPHDWIKMMHKQRKAALKHFDSAKVKGSSFSFSSSCGSVASSGPSSQASQDSSTVLEGEGSSLLHPKQLSTSARSCGISTLPFATPDAMWSKAEEYLNSSNNVVQAPGDDPKSKMVTSLTGNTYTSLCSSAVTRPVCL